MSIDRTCLDAKKLDDALQDLNGWSANDTGTAIHKTFQFEDFSEAWGFMSRAALEAEKLDHHPDWSNVYNRVTVVLNTHDAGGVTKLDILLAEKMNAL